MRLRTANTILTTLVLAVLAFAVVAELPPPSASAQELAAPEYKIKAAYLYNFAKLTDWPEDAFPDPDAPFTVGVLGKDPFAGLLEQTVKDKTIAGRKIVIVHFQQWSEVKDCQLLFVCSSAGSPVSMHLKRLSEKPILTVGDIEGFVNQGGIIGLIKRGAEIRFEINREVAKQARLKLSSKLLRLAENVLPETSKEEE